MLLTLRSSGFDELGHTTMGGLVSWLEGHGFSSAARIAESASELVSTANELSLSSEHKWNAVKGVSSKMGSPLKEMESAHYT